MGITLEDILEELNRFRDNVEYFLSIKGYTATDIDNALGDLEQKLKEANEEVK